MKLEEKRLTIQAKKYDGRPHYSWEGTILKQMETYLVVANTPGRTLHHHRRDTIYTYDNYSLEFYPLNADFTVGLDVELTGEATSGQSLMKTNFWRTNSCIGILSN